MCIEIEAKLKIDSLLEVEQIKQKALSCEKVIAAMDGKEPKKIILIKSRLVNIVI
jgi:leucyl-tRNA synthetase